MKEATNRSIIDVWYDINTRAIDMRDTEGMRLAKELHTAIMAMYDDINDSLTKQGEAWRMVTAIYKKQNPKKTFWEKLFS